MSLTLEEAENLLFVLLEDPATTDEISRTLTDHGLLLETAEMLWREIQIKYGLCNPMGDDEWCRDWQNPDAKPWTLHEQESAMDELEPKLVDEKPTAPQQAAGPAMNFCPNCGYQLKQASTPAPAKAAKKKKAVDDGKRKTDYNEVIAFIDSLEPGVQFAFTVAVDMFLQKYPDVRRSSASACFSGVHANPDYSKYITARRHSGDDGISRRTFGALTNKHPEQPENSG